MQTDPTPEDQEIEDIYQFANRKVYEGDLETAKRALVVVLGRKHDAAIPHLLLAQILLTQGDYRNGWTEWQWRHYSPQEAGLYPNFTSMPWNGMTLPDGHLFILCDQGYGDCIQFARFVRQARRRVGKVILGVDPLLRPLLEPVIGKWVDVWISKWDEIPPHALHTFLSDLPRIFDARIDNLPQPISLRPDPTRVAKFRDLLSGHTGRRIGVSWTGRYNHPSNHVRSIPIEAFGHFEGADMVSFLKPISEADRPKAKRLGILDVSEHLHDLNDTLALAANMDRIITADTSTAHLAGSLKGMQTDVVISHCGDWRWGESGLLTPWYPRVTVHRQETIGDWKSALRSVDLQDYIHSMA